MSTVVEDEASERAAVQAAVAELTEPALVRRFLLSITDPELPFDERGVELAGAVAEATDVLDRLARTGALIRHQERWHAELEAAFVQRGGRWARTAGACVESMARLGVPAATLAAAGLR